MSEFIDWSALRNVVLVGIAVGAGLPALFALGVRALAGPGAADATGLVLLARRAIAVACFAVVVAAVVAGLVLVVNH